MGYMERLKQLQQAARCLAPLPRYQCHKKVWALKIREVELLTPTVEELQAILDGSDIDVSAVLTPEDVRYSPFGVTRDYVLKHEPKAGGYFVMYENGYLSFSPAEPFEKGYTKL